ncbi:MAG TPA: amino acid ABC transporter substrate-binding protein [Stellaceae bacterium]|nr:amino acid ABC transporter substrate-binding protein [Stellaceae bacterium]
MKKVSTIAAAAILSLAAATAAQAGPTLDKIKSAGVLTCGVSTGVAGFSLADSQGKFTGIDVDICRAIAAAVLGDATKVKFVPLSAQQRFTALQSGEVDILSRNTTWTLQRDGSLGFEFAPVVFYDGQGFMVAKKLGVKSAKELSGATVCVQPGTTTELNLADFFRSNKLDLKPVVIESQDEVENSFFTGRCDAYTTDSSALASARVTKASVPDDFVILPERISKEPLAPAVRKGDDEFYDVVRWSVFALFQSEEKGISSKTVDEALKSDDPDVKRFLGVTPGNGKSIGIDEKWAYNIIKQVGNYGEVYDRNVGVGSPLKLERGLNDLWTKGGLMYSPPAR